MQKVPMAWDAARGLLVSGWASLRSDLRWEMPKVELGVVVSRRVTGSCPTCLPASEDPGLYDCLLIWIVSSALSHHTKGGCEVEDRLSSTRVLYARHPRLGRAFGDQSIHRRFNQIAS